MLKAALNIEPDNIEVLTTLALAYFALEQFSEALPYLQHAYRLDPSDPNPSEGLVIIFLRTARWDEVIKHLEVIYPLHREIALQGFRDLLATFSDHIFDRLIELCNKPT